MESDFFYFPKKKKTVNLLKHITIWFYVKRTCKIIIEQSHNTLIAIIELIDTWIGIEQKRRAGI
jgi:hypothetical protein